MTESMHLVHESCGTGHFTVGGADNDLRKALTIARHGYGEALTVLERKKENRQPKGGMGGRYTATTQGF